MVSYAFLFSEIISNLKPLKDICTRLLIRLIPLFFQVSNQEAVDIARPLCIDTPQPLTACKMLADLSASRGSSDDISVMLIQLGRYI